MVGERYASCLAASIVVAMSCGGTINDQVSWVEESPGLEVPEGGDVSQPESSAESASDQSATGQCPLVGVNYNEDPCRNCPGLPCSDGVTCVANPHNLGNPSFVTCTCVDGHMACCNVRDNFGFCDYGPVASPPCPENAPATGDPCGPNPFSCNFASPCCDTLRAFGYCDGTRWQMRCDAQTIFDFECNLGAVCHRGAEAGDKAEGRCEAVGAKASWQCGTGAGGEREDAAPEAGVCPPAQPPGGTQCNFPASLTCQYASLAPGAYHLITCRCGTDAGESHWSCVTT